MPSSVRDAAQWEGLRKTQQKRVELNRLGRKSSCSWTLMLSLEKVGIKLITCMMVWPKQDSLEQSYEMLMFTLPTCAPGSSGLPLQLLEQIFLCSGSQELSPVKLSHVPSPTRRHLSPLSRQCPHPLYFSLCLFKIKPRFKLLFRGLPGGIEVKNLPSSAGGLGLICGQGARLHTLQLRVPCCN